MGEPFTFISPFPVKVADMPQAIENLTSVLGPFSLKEAMRIFWKLDTINLSGTVTFSSRVTEDDGNVVAEDLSYEMSATPSDADTLCRFPPHLRARNTNIVYSTAKTEGDNVYIMALVGPYFLSEDDADKAFEDRKFAYLFRMCCGINHRAFLTAQLFPHDDNTFVSVSQTEFYAPYPRAFKMYFMRKNPELGGATYTNSAGTNASVEFQFLD